MTPAVVKMEENKRILIKCCMLLIGNQASKRQYFLQCIFIVLSNWRTRSNLSLAMIKHISTDINKEI